jgi:hypothetical protein
MIKCACCGKEDGPGVKLVMDVLYRGQNPVCAECIELLCADEVVMRKELKRLVLKSS